MKAIRVIVDEKGDVKLDLSGYEGDNCRIEENRFRKSLEEFGLSVDVKIKPKSGTQIEGETAAKTQSGGKIKV